LKGIGACIDKAAELERIDLNLPLEPNHQLPKDTLVFWKNIHFLRNNLIHHFDKNMINKFCLNDIERDLLFKIVNGCLNPRINGEELKCIDLLKSA
jgi:hypothetical protein